MTFRPTLIQNIRIGMQINVHIPPIYIAESTPNPVTIIYLPHRERPKVGKQVAVKIKGKLYVCAKLYNLTSHIKV